MTRRSNPRLSRERTSRSMIGSPLMETRHFGATSANGASRLPTPAASSSAVRTCARSVARSWRCIRVPQFSRAPQLDRSMGCRVDVDGVVEAATGTNASASNAPTVAGRSAATARRTYPAYLFCRRTTNLATPDSAQGSHSEVAHSTPSRCLQVQGGQLHAACRKLDGASAAALAALLVPCRKGRRVE